MELLMAGVAALIAFLYAFNNKVTGEGRAHWLGPAVLGLVLIVVLALLDFLTALLAIWFTAAAVVLLWIRVLTQQYKFPAVIKEVDTENRAQRPMAIRRPVLLVRNELTGQLHEIAVGWSKYERLQKTVQNLQGKRVLIATWKWIEKNKTENPPRAHTIRLLKADST